MDPLTMEIISRSGKIVHKLNKKWRKSRFFKRLRAGCLLLIAISLMVLMFLVSGLPTVLGFYTVPPLEFSQLGNIPPGMKNANNHFMGTGGPLPRNVILNPSIEALAKEVGLWDQEVFDPYYQVKGCIAAAYYIGVPRELLCTIMHIEGGWEYPELESRNFTTAVAVARGLLKLEYNPNRPQIEWIFVDAEGNECESPADETCIEPVTRECGNKTCEALYEYFEGQVEYLDLLVSTQPYWEVANTAEIEEYEKEEWPVHWYWLHVNLGLDDAHILNSGGAGVTIIDGVPVVLEPGTIPPNELPNIPDGAFVHTVDGGYVSGYRFSSSHPGTDYSRRPTGWAVAAHNCEVTFVGWDGDGYGNYVTCAGSFPDGTSVWSLYGHGKTRTPRQVGDNMRAGDAILEIGSTGNSSGPHLHFELKLGGVYVNPEAVLPPQ